MAVPEIPDSEDEPLTSSPQVPLAGNSEDPVVREPLLDAHQASTKDASRAATNSEESLNQSTIFSSDHTRPANLQFNTIAQQQAHGIESDQHDEQFPAADEGTVRHEAAPMRHDVISPGETVPGIRSINAQEADSNDDEDNSRPNASEEVTATEHETAQVHEETSASTHSPVLSSPNVSPNEQVPILQQVDEESVSNPLPPSQLQATSGANSEDDRSYDKTCAESEHAPVSQSPQHTSNVSQLAPPQDAESSTVAMDWGPSVEKNAQTITLIPPKHKSPPSECSSAEGSQTDRADNVPSSNITTHTSNTPVLLGTNSDIHGDATMSTAEARVAPPEESALRYEILSESVPVGTASSSTLRPEGSSPGRPCAMKGTDWQCEVELENNTSISDCRLHADVQATSPKAAGSSQDLTSVLSSEQQRTNDAPDGPVASLPTGSSTIPLPETHEANTKGNETLDIPAHNDLQHQPQQPPPSIPEPKLPTKTPQEVTLAELKAQRAALIASLAALPKVQDLIAAHESEDESSQASTSEPTDAEVTAAANKLVKAHIKLLHEYNETKDVGQGLMGLIADQRGVRIVEVQDEFGLDSND